MLEKINQELRDLQETVLLKDKTSDKVHDLRVELDKLLRTKQKYFHSLEEEKNDVEKLKSLSLSSLYYSMIGRKAERLDKEEREVLNAKLKVDRLESECLMLADELDFMENKLSDILKKERLYIRLFEEKKQLIMDEYDQADQIVSLEDKKEKIKKIKVETLEAIHAGNDAKDKLHKAEDMLRSARNWGIYDMVSNKSLISSIVKHNKLKTAQAIMGQANHALSRFRKELNDVEDTFTDKLTFSNFVKTFDIFFDNIFTDFHVQNKIAEARNDVANVINNIDHAIPPLIASNEKNDRLIAEIDDQIADIILSAK